MSRTPVADAIIAVAAAVVAPVVALLIDTNTVTAQVGADIGLIATAAVGAFHGGKAVANRAAAKSGRSLDAHLADSPRNPAPAASAPAVAHPSTQPGDGSMPGKLSVVPGDQS